MNLYEIEQEIMECFDIETGEILDEARFEALEMEREKKIENTCLYIKNLRAEAEALKKEEDSFAARRKAVENRMESLKRYMTGYLDGTPFKTPKVKVSFRKSEAVEISEGAVVPQEYCKVKVEVSKTELKKAIKEGKTFEGISIVERKNISIS